MHGRGNRKYTVHTVCGVQAWESEMWLCVTVRLLGCAPRRSGASEGKAEATVRQSDRDGEATRILVARIPTTSIFVVIPYLGPVHRCENFAVKCSRKVNAREIRAARE